MRTQGGTVARNPLLEGWGRREPRHEQGSVPFGPRRFECLRTANGTIKRRMGLLERLRRQGDLRDLPELPLIREALLRPRSLENLQGLFIPRPQVLHRDPQPLKVLGIHALADAHVEAAPLRMSSIAKSSALRRGCSRGSTLTAVPRRSRA